MSGPVLHSLFLDNVLMLRFTGDSFWNNGPIREFNGLYSVTLFWDTMYITTDANILKVGWRVNRGVIDGVGLMTNYRRSLLPSSKTSRRGRSSEIR